MDSDERTVLQAALKKTMDLFKRRTSHEDWARNLREGSSELKTDLQWKHFYTFLGNPRGYDENNVCVESSEKEHATLELKPYEDCFEIHEYKNGNETTIYVKNIGDGTAEQDDEKVDV